ncbi:uncharacterized protein MKK02DRAFT_39030 [Dioszegia hungarica]|uniref:Uncharacterized protein n=1 Tax=Dioszegia hungarica TaxID=4972 RepID=A0AA38H6G7_9TREE|nr:uncharacterized protein MKK02DRAFT_39030 [Dioszegia hungarica]KAI9633409.1 hypothetical protein MKK02DRAFT_39030 [Dioszegia hungarica]
MSLLANVLGFSAFGFGVRCFQLGLQKEGMFTRPLGHIGAAAAFGGIGYAVYHMEQRQNHLLADRKKELQTNRDRENAEYAARKAEAAA